MAFHRFRSGNKAVLRVGDVAVVVTVAIASENGESLVVQAEDGTIPAPFGVDPDTGLKTLMLARKSDGWLAVFDDGRIGLSPIDAGG